MAHASKRTSGRSDDWVDKRPVQICAEVVSRQFGAVALEGDFVIWQRDSLHSGNRLRGTRLGDDIPNEQADENNAGEAQGAESCAPMTGVLHQRERRALSAAGETKRW